MSQLKKGKFIHCGLTILIISLFSLCHLRIMTQLRSGNVDQGRIQGGAIAPLKPKKVIFFTMIFYNSENSIHNIRLFGHPFFCHSSVVKYTSSVLK